MTQSSNLLEAYIVADHPSFHQTMDFGLSGSKRTATNNTKPIKTALSLDTDQRRHFTVKEIPQIPRFSWLTESSLRHLIDRSKTVRGSRGYEIKGNGFAPCVFRMGSKILIDTVELDKWVEAHRMSN